MSNYNSERGTFKIPQKEIVKLRKRIVQAHITDQLRLRETFNGKVDRMRALLKAHDSYAVMDQMRLTDAEEDLFYQQYQNRKLAKVTKKALNLPTLSQQRVVLQEGELTVTIDTAKRMLYWDISENNRAVDRARATRLAQVTLSALRALNWTQGSGGEIRYMDEYLRDEYEDARTVLSLGPR